MAEYVLDFEKPVLEMEKRIEELREFSSSRQIDLSEEISRMEERLAQMQRKIFSSLTPWQRVQLARHPMRPQSTDYIAMMLEDFVELKGDRLFREDPAVIAGFGMLERHRVAVIGHRRGKTTTERVACNFGSAHPEGYRKAMRVMQLAARFGMPVVTLIDTMGAYPGIGAEERGQAQAIAACMLAMCSLEVPVVCVVIGEGGSGGAIGIGVGNRLLILENAFYSVISPEGCAAILWKDAAKRAEAAEALKLTSHDLQRLGIADEVVPEPPGGAHRKPREMAETLKERLLVHLRELKKLSPSKLVESRYEKYRKIGFFGGGKDA